MNKELISIFESVRDKPMRIPLNIEDNDYRCWGKHRILKKELEKQGYTLRFRVCLFKWSDQRFPQPILNIPHIDDDYHLYLEININNNWITLDCSNDNKLPDYNKWDEINNCTIAVKYSKILSPEESIKIESQEKKNFKNLLENNKEFYSAINDFLEKLREMKSK